MLASACSMRRRVVLVTRVHRLEAAAIDRHHAARQQANLPADRNERRVARSQRLSVIPPEVSDRLEVRRQLAKKPHQFGVALRLPLQPPARLHLVQVAVEVQLQQLARVIARPPRRGRPYPAKTQRRQVQLIDEDIDHPDRVVLRHVVFKMLRKQIALNEVTAPKPERRAVPDNDTPKASVTEPRT